MKHCLIPPLTIDNPPWLRPWSSSSWILKTKEVNDIYHLVNDVRYEKMLKYTFQPHDVYTNYPLSMGDTPLCNPKTRQKLIIIIIIFFFFFGGGATLHIPLNKSATLHRPLHCSLWQFSGALVFIFEGSCLHFGGEITQSPRVIFFLPRTNPVSMPMVPYVQKCVSTAFIPAWVWEGQWYVWDLCDLLLHGRMDVLLFSWPSSSFSLVLDFWKERERKKKWLRQWHNIRDVSGSFTKIWELISKFHCWDGSWTGNYATCGSCHLAHAVQSAHTPLMLQRYDRWVSCTN